MTTATQPTTWTRAALDYFASRAIDPAAAEKAGVRDGQGWLYFPNGRKRRLVGEGPKFVQPSGKPLGIWKLKPSTAAPPAPHAVLVCEGESDSLAALSTLPATPPETGLQDLAIVSVPGVGFPVERLVNKLWDYAEAYLAFDSDERGQAYLRKVIERCVDDRGNGVRPIGASPPWSHKDLATWLACQPASKRAKHFAGMLVDCEADAPSLQDRHRMRQIEWFKGRIAKLEGELAGGGQRAA